MADSSTGVLLMSFGAAATPQDVPAYLERVRRAKPPPELVAEFQRRYRLAGGSPLVRNTWAQALALESLLQSQEYARSSFRRKPESSAVPEKKRFTVSIGMRHTPPFIEEGFGQLVAKGVSQVVGVILSPQYSPYIMGGYHRALEQAREAVAHHLAVPQLPVRVAGAWHTVPAFIDALARRLSDALDECPAAERDKVAVLMTAHSLPKAVADQEPDYLQQLRQTAGAVAQRVGLPPHRWQFAYQSAGHTPQEWLRPDIKELFPTLRQAGHRHALVVPVQFLSDHLEVLYDIDVAAREQAEESGIELRRIQTPCVMPELIQALAEVVRRELTQTPTG